MTVQVFDLENIMAGFVTRSGSTLSYNGAPFKFFGANAFWVGLAYSGISFPTPRYPTSYEIDDLFLTCQEMGVTVLRCQSLGNSVGNATTSLTLMPTQGTFSETAFRHIDYVIYRAAAFGIKLWIPLTDYYNYYLGGIHTWASWNSVTDLAFYTDTTTINNFKTYVAGILNRVNVYTGIAYKNDPTIMIWETGNELQNIVSGNVVQAPATWTQTITDYIKSIDSNHLTMDGSYGVATANLAIASCDIYGNHFYPPSLTVVNRDASLCAGAGKCYLIGEFDWRSINPALVDAFIANCVSNPNINGIASWNTQPHHPTGGFNYHNDGFSIYYPGLSTGNMFESDFNRVSKLRDVAYAYQSMTRSYTKIVPAPRLVSCSGISNGATTVAWQGSAGAAYYNVEISPYSAVGPWQKIATNITDFQVPFSLAVTPDSFGYYVRVQPFSVFNVPGTYSNILHTNQAFTVDLCCNYDQMFSTTNGLKLDTSNSQYFPGAICRIKRNAATAEEIIYNVSGITLAQITAFFSMSEAILDFTFLTSPDNVTYTSFSGATSVITTGTVWQQVVYALASLPSGTNYLKIRWNNLSGLASSPQLAQIAITSAI
jgi:hypothetical protein